MIYDTYEYRLEIARLTQSEKDLLISLALGRIIKLGSRPFQEGDYDIYEDCKKLILDLCPDTPLPYTVDYARDRLKGAQGD